MAFKVLISDICQTDKNPWCPKMMSFDASAHKEGVRSSRMHFYISNVSMSRFLYVFSGFCV